MWKVPESRGWAVGGMSGHAATTPPTSTNHTQATTYSGRPVARSGALMRPPAGGPTIKPSTANTCVIPMWRGSSSTRTSYAAAMVVNPASTTAVPAAPCSPRMQAASVMRRATSIWLLCCRPWVRPRMTVAQLATNAPSTATILGRTNRMVKSTMGAKMSVAAPYAPNTTLMYGARPLMSRIHLRGRQGGLCPARGAACSDASCPARRTWESKGQAN